MKFLARALLLKLALFEQGKTQVKYFFPLESCEPARLPLTCFKMFLLLSRNKLSLAEQV